jgi:hypothetical protein
MKNIEPFPFMCHLNSLRQKPIKLARAEACDRLRNGVRAPTECTHIGMV